MLFAPNSTPRRRFAWAATWLVAGIVCVEAVVSTQAGSGERSAPARLGRLDTVAEDYVRLALALGRTVPREIDGYSGPSELRDAVTTLSPAEIARRAHALGAGLAASGPAEDQARRMRIVAQLRALHTVASTHASQPTPLPFDAEARELYGLADTVAVSLADVDVARRALARLAPGPGALIDRVSALRARFLVPRDRRRPAFEAAVAECRARTAAHWPLPQGEHVRLAWGLGGPWGAWHRYEGGFASVLDVSTASLELADSIVDVACHESYPGHHAQFVLLDHAAGQGRPDAELTVALLRSPLSTLREGAASYAVDLAFPPADRLRFERDVLFPLAGLDPRGAADMLRLRALLRRVEPAVAPIARAYRDGRLSREAAAQRLRDEALVAVPGPLLRFVDELGAYVVGYGAARDRVAAAVEARASSAGVDRWRALGELLIESNPSTLQIPPSGSGAVPDPDRR
jgi:hypothetical protein